MDKRERKAIVDRHTKSILTSFATYRSVVTHPTENDDVTKALEKRASSMAMEGTALAIERLSNELGCEAETDRS